MLFGIHPSDTSGSTQLTPLTGDTQHTHTHKKCKTHLVGLTVYIACNTTSTDTRTTNSPHKWGIGGAALLTVSRYRPHTCAPHAICLPDALTCGWCWSGLCVLCSVNVWVSVNFPFRPNRIHYICINNGHRFCTTSLIRYLWGHLHLASQICVR